MSLATTPDISRELRQPVDTSVDGELVAWQQTTLEAPVSLELDAPVVVDAPAPAAVAEPAPEEPVDQEVYIDRGPELAERWDGPRVQLLVQGPDCAFVYWEGPPEPGHWRVEAVDAEGHVLDGFDSHAAQGEGFLSLPTDRLHRVRVRRLDGAVELSTSLPRPPALPEPQEAASGPWTSFSTPRVAATQAPVRVLPHSVLPHSADLARRS